LAGVLAATLAFFVVFSELIKLFFSIVINHLSNLGLPINDHEKEGAARLDEVAARNDVDSPFKYVPRNSVLHHRSIPIAFIAEYLLSHR
jgi:hypothetical protein